MSLGRSEPSGVLGSRASSDGGPGSYDRGARSRLTWCGLLAEPVFCSSREMLALLISWPGAKLGANVAGHLATPGHVQPE